MIERLFEMVTPGGLGDPLPADPMPMLRQWFEEAKREARVPNPNAFALATATPDGRPSARMLLCRAIEADPPAMVFFTNRESRKGAELAANPRAAAVFHWDHQDRQARLEGPVTRVADEESDRYFATRPLLSRLGAWASLQSRPLESRAALVSAVVRAAKQLKLDPSALLSGDAAGAIAIPRPPYWGGFRLHVERLELWIGSSGRLHDRAEWRRTADPAAAAGLPVHWDSTRLNP